MSKLGTILSFKDYLFLVFGLFIVNMASCTSLPCAIV